MLKLVFLCRRRPELSPAAYAERLLAGHVPLALRHHPTMAGYVVNLVEVGPSGCPAYDSVGELWFPSLADYEERLYDSDEGRELVQRDVAGFLAGADAYVTVEHVHKDAHPRPSPGERSAGVKLVCPLRRRYGMTHDAFVAHWLGRHVPLALARGMFDSAQGEGAIREDMARFIGRTAAYRVAEYVQRRA